MKTDHMIYFQNISGETALHSAAQYGHVAVVDVLLQVRPQKMSFFNTIDVLEFQTLVLAKNAQTNSADPDQTASEEAV